MALPRFWNLYFLVFTVLGVIIYCCDTLYRVGVFAGFLLVLIHVSWQLARYLYAHFINTERVNPAKRAVLVTGCDSGFGHEIAKRLDTYGFVVFAGVLFPDGEGAAGLRDKCSSRLHVVPLDVTKDDSVAAALEYVTQEGTPLWGLVNNAGISSFTMWDWGKGIEEYERQMQVNLFGLVRVTRAFLPLMRKSGSRDGGRIVNMCSMAGRFGFPGLTGYCMTKFGVRAFSDGLRRELWTGGAGETRTGGRIKVSVIEPNLYKTPISDEAALTRNIERVWSSTEPAIQDYYGAEFPKRFKTRLLKGLAVARSQIHEVVDAAETALTLTDPPIYFRCAGPGERIGLWLCEHLSDSAEDFVLSGRMWGRILNAFKTRN